MKTIHRKDAKHAKNFIFHKIGEADFMKESAAWGGSRFAKR
jgi:hypothetical protein